MSLVYIDEVGYGSLERAKKALESISGGAYKAVGAALRRAGNTGKTKAGRFAAEEYTISKGTFMGNVKIRTSVHKEAGMSIEYAGNVLSLRKYNVKDSRPRGVHAQVKRNGGGGNLYDAFIVPSKGGQVFERKGDPRLPIEKKHGPATGQQMANKHIVDKMEKTIIEEYEKRIDHEILRLMNGW